MTTSIIDFLVLNSRGIDLFIQYVDAAVVQTGEPYEQAVKRLQQELKAYIVSRDAFNERPIEAPVPSPLMMSLNELMSRDTCGTLALNAVSRNVVYIVRDGQRTLYVGSTRYNARTRLKSHEKSHSPLGEALRTDPGRERWNVEMIPHADYDSAYIKEKELIAQLAPEFCRRV